MRQEEKGLGQAETKLFNNMVKIFRENSMRRITGILLVVALFSCRPIPEEVEEVIDYAGSNRGELKKVLRHYGWRDRDSLKFRAACFLIENMKWHYSTKKVERIDPRFEWFCRVADSAYQAVWEEMGGSLDSLSRCERLFRNRMKWLADSVRKCEFRPSVVSEGVFPDLSLVGSRFLIGHIDNAFRQWERSSFARSLSFDEFCEYLLPYRSLHGYPLTAPGNVLAEKYGRFVCCDSAETLAQHILRYNRRIAADRNLLGWRPFSDFGIYNLSFRGHDCIDVAVWGADILRACGIPVKVEYCDAYRSFAGRHFYCSVLDERGEWQGFSVETEVPDPGKFSIGSMMNVYRRHYGARKDSPYYLRNAGEYLPPVFASPCFREVTAIRADVAAVRLPFPVVTSNRLAYLAAFQARRAPAPVTWGTVDSVRQEVCFENTMFDRLYFPVYYEGKELRSFGDPFYITRDSTLAEGYRMHRFHADTSLREDILLTRKFSRKPNMIKLAEELVGASFIGANRYDFSDAQVLYTIQTPPRPGFQDYVLPRPVKFKHLRFKSPDTHPHANVGTVEYLTDRKYGYSNVMEPVALTVCSPADTSSSGLGKQWVKLMDVPWEKMKRRPESDGNMQTAPSAYRMVTMRLKEPQMICRIRFAPKNADNGIHRGEEYELFYWDGEWKSLGYRVPPYEYLEYRQVPRGALLWLRNYTSGKEEMPFILQDGRQVFLYPDLIP